MRKTGFETFFYSKRRSRDSWVKIGNISIDRIKL